MRSFRNILYGALLALAAVGPGMAAPVNNMWRVSTGEIIAIEVRVNTTGTMTFATFLQPISATNPRGSWTFCNTAYANSSFTCTEIVPRGGQVIGGEYRAPDTSQTGRTITVNMATLRMRVGDEPEASAATISPIELVSGGLTAEILANMPATGIYVPRIKLDDFPNFTPVQSGTGTFLTSQSNYASVAYLTYASDGAPIWYSMSGPVVVSANVVTLTGDFALAGGETILGRATFQSRNNGGHRLDPPGVFSNPDYEHWVTPLRSSTF